jgi:hypothetical protein
MEICPKCDTKRKDIIVCDNDCGTVICEHCDTEYYDKNVIGHNPTCSEKIFIQMEKELREKQRQLWL